MSGPTNQTMFLWDKAARQICIFYDLVYPFIDSYTPVCVIIGLVRIYWSALRCEIK